MKYIKKFEQYLDSNYSNYIIEKNNNHVLFFMEDIMDYLKVFTQQAVNFGEKLTNAYNINLIDFLKEIFLHKRIEFISVDKIAENPLIKGKVEDIDEFGYQDEFYITFKLYGKKNWYLVDTEGRNNDNVVKVYKYDAEDKPLHKEVRLKKEVEKYNL